MNKVIRLQGMSCGHCVGHVENALGGICGVKSVDIDLQSQSATIELAHDVETRKLKAAIEDAGYEFISVV